MLFVLPEGALGLFPVVLELPPDALELLPDVLELPPDVLELSPDVLELLLESPSDELLLLDFVLPEPEFCLLTPAYPCPGCSWILPFSSIHAPS